MADHLVIYDTERLSVGRKSSTPLGLQRAQRHMLSRDGEPNGRKQQLCKIHSVRKEGSSLTGLALMDLLTKRGCCKV